ncbi:MAG: hypothetical protein AAFO03_28615 [Bacteroidota bacterium]
MQLLKTLPYFFLTATMIVALPLVFGAAEECKTFGISGTITFEDASAKGALVVFTTSDNNPFEKDAEETLHFEQYLQESGYFYRKLNEFGGQDVNIWIKQKGYPVIQVSKVLNTGDDQITFGEVNIPAKLKVSNEAPVNFFKAPCDVDPIVSVEPEKIRAVREFYAVKCESTNTVQFKATIDLEEDAHEALNVTSPTLVQRLAVVVF